MASVKQVAAHLGVSTKRIRQLIEEGTIEKQPPCGYDLDSCRQAYLQRLRSRASGGGAPRDPTLAEIKHKLSLVDLDSATLRLAVVRGEVVSNRTVGDVYGRALVNLRGHLISLGSRIADVAVTCSTRGEVKRLVDGEIEAGLQELRQHLFDTDWLKEAAAQSTPRKLSRPTKADAMLRDRGANGEGNGEAHE